MTSPEMTRRKAFPAFQNYGTVITENRLSKCTGKALRAFVDVGCQTATPPERDHELAPEKTVMFL